MQDVVSESYTDKPKGILSYVNSKGHSTSQEQTRLSPEWCKADILNEQFTSVFTNEDNRDIPDKGFSPYPAMPDILISQNRVQTLLKDFNPNEETGPDQILTRLLKMGAEELVPVLAKLYQYSIDSGELPQEWRDANVVPNFKKGADTNLRITDQYRLYLWCANLWNT